MRSEEKTIREWLSACMNPRAECMAEEIVSDHGSAFKGVKLPRGFRRMAAKQCFRNSFILASTERGEYCEDFAVTSGSMPFHHAWVSIDDSKAIDVTLPNPHEYSYLGIQFSPTSLLRLGKGGYGQWGFLRPPLDKRLLLDLIQSDRQRDDSRMSPPPTIE